MPIYGGQRLVDFETDLSQVESYLASIEGSNASISVTVGSVAYESASIVQYQGGIKANQTTIVGHQGNIDTYTSSIQTYGQYADSKAASIESFTDTIKGYETGRVTTSDAGGDLVPSDTGWPARQPIEVSADGAGGMGAGVIIIPGGAIKHDIEFYFVASITAQYSLPFCTDPTGALTGPSAGSPNWLAGGTGGDYVTMYCVAGYQYGPFHYKTGTLTEDFGMYPVPGGGASSWPANAGLRVWADYRSVP